jgi:hypothetical protein
MKNINLENRSIKNLSIFIEMRARDGDPQMGHNYRHYISSIFNKIKVKFFKF